MSYAPTLFDNPALSAGRPLDAPRSLERFLVAHAYGNAYRNARAEILAGVKRTHWMWFVFPQMVTTDGASRMSRYYSLANKAEAVAYLENPTLRMRLAVCATGVLKQRHLMFSHVDRAKLRSSMTLFAQVAQDPALPNALLAKFFDGPDKGTLELLKAQEEGTVARYWEKNIRKAKATVAEVASPPDDKYGVPWTRSRIEGFVKGFGLNRAQTSLIVDAWIADGERSRDAGWEAHGDSIWYDNEG